MKMKKERKINEIKEGRKTKIGNKRIKSRQKKEQRKEKDEEKKREGKKERNK